MKLLCIWKKNFLKLTHICVKFISKCSHDRNVFGKHWPSQSTKAKAFCNVHAQAQCKKDLRNVCNK